MSGKGRRLTEAGRNALETGNVGARLERARARIATLTSRVTYDPVEDTGELIAAAAYLDDGTVGPALDALCRLSDLPLSPCSVAVEEAAVTEPGAYRLSLPSSLTLDGVLLSVGISTRLITGGIAGYDPASAAGETVTDDPLAAGGGITRYIDVASGENSFVSLTFCRLKIK